MFLQGQNREVQCREPSRAHSKVPHFLAPKSEHAVQKNMTPKRKRDLQKRKHKKGSPLKGKCTVDYKERKKMEKGFS